MRVLLPFSVVVFVWMSECASKSNRIGPCSFSFAAHKKMMSIQYYKFSRNKMDKYLFAKTEKKEMGVDKQTNKYISP